MVKNSSAIRAMFEEGNRMAKIFGAENVYDFSLGNPSIPAPKMVDDTIKELVESGDSVALHGYTSAQGAMPVREQIAANINARFGFPASAKNIYITCGAAASLTSTLKAVVNDGDEVILLAPYFPEYNVFCANAGAKTVVVLGKGDNFSLDFDALDSSEKAERSEEIRKRVNKAREIQNKRFKGTGVTCNAKMTPAMTRQFCVLSEDAAKILENSFEKLGLSARAYDKILKVARTIADLEGKDNIETAHIIEAIQYRSLDKKC